MRHEPKLISKRLVNLASTRSDFGLFQSNTSTNLAASVKITYAGPGARTATRYPLPLTIIV